MKVFIVFAHPEPQSLSHAILKATVDELEAQGHEVQVSDLYAMEWKCTVDRADFPLLETDARLKVMSASKQATLSNALTEDVIREQKKILWADIILFHFPLWWFSPPAIMKGWFDRVLSYGFAYGLGQHTEKRWGDRYGEGPFSGKRAMLVVTVAGWKEHYSSRGINGPIEDLLFPLTHGILFYTGIQVLPSFVHYRADRLQNEEFKALISELRPKLQGLSTTESIAYRRQNFGDYEIPTMVLKPGLESDGATGFALHLAKPGGDV